MSGCMNYAYHIDGEEGVYKTYMVVCVLSLSIYIYPPTPTAVGVLEQTSTAGTHVWHSATGDRQPHMWTLPGKGLLKAVAGALQPAAPGSLFIRTCLL